MERLDKILVSQGLGSRREVGKIIRQRQVTVDGEVVLKPDLKLDPEVCSIRVNGEELSFKKHLYLILNKPSGCVCATEDKLHKTVLDFVPEKLRRRGLFPAGRLDVDTEGLVIITDDGDFAHKILSPRNHVYKTYLACLDGEPTEETVERFKEGVTFRDGTRCLPAELIVLKNRQAIVKICEGKFHQVKKMFAASGLKVEYLKRLSVGGLELSEDLHKGECRELTNAEKSAIFLSK